MKMLEEAVKIIQLLSLKCILRVHKKVKSMDIANIKVHIKIRWVDNVNV